MTIGLLNILGGVALLLWGTGMVRDGVQRAYGSQLRHWLGLGMRNPVSSVGVGVVVTLLLQSSTATAMLMTAFASRGIVETAPALAVLLGADVGTTLVVQVLTLDVAWISPLLLVLGVVLYRNAANTERQEIGRAIMGLGLMLLALHLIVSTSQPLRDAALLHTILPTLEGDVFLLALIGALLAWLAHSSVAAVLLVVSLVTTGVLSLGAAFALVAGINVGGVLPAVVATLGRDPAARRLPVGNLLFKLCGAAVVLVLLPHVVAWVGALGGDPGRQVAHFHTAFNVVLAATFVFFTPAVARLMARLLPSAMRGADPAEPHYLDPAAIKTPPVALALAERETQRIGDVVDEMLRRSMDVFRTGDQRILESIRAMDDVVDALNEAIKLYLTKVSREAMTERNSQRTITIITFATNLEHIGDIVDKNLMELGAKQIRYGLQFSEEGLQEIARMHARLQEHFTLSMTLFMTGDPELARRLHEEKSTFAAMERAAAESHLERLRSGLVESIETSSLHLDILRDFKRINSLITSVVYPILDRRDDGGGDAQTAAARPDRPADSANAGSAEGPMRQGADA